ncbi:MAG: DMT family transporter [Rhodobacteraceae bacterium]|nr:DMT family transporter [Paracoccaceae bacterium]
MTGDVPQRPLRAAVMIIMVCMLFAITTLIAKALGTGYGGEPLHPFMISGGRFLFALIGLSIGAAILRPKITKPDWKTHLLRSLSGWLGITLIFAAMARMPVSDATAISFLNTAFTMVFAAVLLREKIGKFRWIAVGIAFCGAIVLLRPGADVFQPVALIALCAAVATGYEAIIVKRLSGREAPMQILLINNSIGVVIAGIAASFVWTMPSLVQWGMLAAIGSIMICVQALFIQAMRNADASFVMPFMYSTLVFATLYDFWIYGVIPDQTSFIGAGIIIFGVLFLTWREALAHRRQAKVDSPS